MPSTLSDKEVVALSDLQMNIEKAWRFVEGIGLEEFLADEKTFYAATRCLEIISEASRKLSAEFKARYPEIPWPQIAGSGNVYRHNYEDVLERRVWKTVQEALSPLYKIVLIELKQHRGSDFF